MTSIRPARGFITAAVAACVLACILPVFTSAQSASVERSFPQSKTSVEKILPALHGEMAGHLPTLEGFAKSDGLLDRYSRGYYEATVQVRGMASGGTVVRISIKLTAWYSGPNETAGYKLLQSNGRIESDLLDHLGQQLSKASPEEANPKAPTPAEASTEPRQDDTAIPAPSSSSDSRSAFSSSMNQSLVAEERAARTVEKTDRNSDSALRSEAADLEEVLKNQAHPKNLVAVRKSGTPVVSTPSLSAKPQFLASIHDEFEMLDYNADWVHVRISGLSRGWIWRNSVEMPEGIRNNDSTAASTLKPMADSFNVIREETAPFPGDWAQLQNKNVKIITVQKTDEKSKENDSAERLEYAKFLFEKNYAELSRKPQEISGIVVIFDSADGGMVAVPWAALQQWRTGALSDSALWHKCFFDPPETFESRSPQAAQ